MSFTSTRPNRRIAKCARIFPFAAVLASLLSLSANADAGIGAVHADFLPLSGPVFLDNGIAWAARRADGGFNVLLSAGRRTKTIGRFPGNARETLDPNLVGAGRNLALEYTETPRAGEVNAGPYYDARLWAGGLWRELVANCDSALNWNTVASLGLDGGRVVHRGPSCERVTVSDDQSNATLAALPGDAFAERIAGDFVAWYSEGEVHVENWSTGRTAYVLPRSDFPYNVNDIAVTNDGEVTVAYSVVVGHRFFTRVGQATTSSPDLKDIDLPDAGSVNFRQLGARIVILRAPRNSNVSGWLGTLELRTASGKLVTRIASGVAGGYLTNLFDATGNSVAYAMPKCNGVLLRVVPVDRTDRLAPLPHICGLRMSHRARITNNRTQVTLNLSCVGSARACRARSADIWTVGRRRLLLAHAFSAEAGGTTHLRLSHAGRQLLRPGRRVRVRITTDLTTGSGVIHRAGAVTLTF